MSLPITFSALPAGNNPAADLDTMFNVVAAFGTIPCAAAGVNAIALTPFTGCPPITSYPDLAPNFRFAAASTSTGAVTINVSGVGARNAYKWNGQNPVSGQLVPVAGGDIMAGNVYDATPLAALNGGAGGFVVNSIGISQVFSAIEFVIDGGGNPIITGNKGAIYIPFAAGIQFWSIIADQPGSIEIDILRTNAGVPATSMVGGGTMPFLSAQQIQVNDVPTGWTSTQLFLNDFIAFNVLSASSVTRATISLGIVKL